LFFAFLDRQAQGRDRMALDLARQIQLVAPKVTAKPEVSFGLETLQAAGLVVPKPLMVSLLSGPKDPGGWKLSVWHPDGTRRYLVTQSKIQGEYI